MFEYSEAKEHHNLQGKREASSEVKIGPTARKVIDEMKKDPATCIKQIEDITRNSCTGAHPIKYNICWIAIKELITEPRGTGEAREKIEKIKELLHTQADELNFVSQMAGTMIKIKEIIEGV